MTTASRAIGTRGRRPKGGAHRAQLVARVPKEHAEHYVQAAADLGLPLCDFIAMKMAESTGLDVPQYVLSEIEAHRRAQDQALLADTDDLMVAS